MRVGSVIRKWRIIEEKSLVKVADEIGINHQSLRRLEEGKAPTAEVMIAVVKWLCSEEQNGNHAGEREIAGDGNERAHEAMSTEEN